MRVYTLLFVQSGLIIIGSLLYLAASIAVLQSLYKTAALIAIWTTSFWFAGWLCGQLYKKLQGESDDAE